MRTKTKINDYNAHIYRAHDIITSLRPHLHPATLQMVKLQLKESERIGENTEGGDWNNNGNTRHSYHTVIPGMIAEMIAATNLQAEISGALVHAYERHTQVTKAIDFYIGETSFQVKAVRFIGLQLTVNSNWFKGEADYICLVDIDDREHYVVARQSIAPHVKCITKTELKNKAILFFNNRKLYE